MRALPLLITLLLSGPVSAGDGTHLVVACENAQHMWSGKAEDEKAHRDLAYCSGLINGVVGALVITANSTSSTEAHRLGICHPTKRGEFIPTDQAVRVVQKFLNTHPEKLHEPDVVLAMTALKDAFECPAP